jgi:hypothetical protein
MVRGLNLFLARATTVEERLERVGFGEGLLIVVGMCNSCFLLPTGTGLYERVDGSEEGREAASERGSYEYKFAVHDHWDAWLDSAGLPRIHVLSSVTNP